MPGARTVMLHLRALAFYGCMVFTTPAFVALLLLSYPLPYRTRYALGRTWARVTLATLRLFCGVHWSFQGLEHLPAGAAVVMCKHQSAWETMALQQVLPPQVWILKRELLWVPLFGWGLALLDPIAIDRRAGLRAMKTLVRAGSERLARGIWVIVFPEGTRTRLGERRAYQRGGGMLAEHTGCPVVPVAHDAGRLWPRSSFLKHPGRITCVIGPAIDPRGKGAAEITREAEDWIESTCAMLAGGAGPVQDTAPRTGAAPEQEPT